MNKRVVKLPLFPDPSYAYEVSLEGRSYRIELHYIERNQSWVMNIYESDGRLLLAGKRVVFKYPMIIHHILPLTGYFYFDPIGVMENYTVRERLRLDKYFNLYYVYEEEE